MKEWIKRNWILIGIIILAIAIRIYYFILTQGQVVWYDESVYMLISQRFAFGLDYTFGPVRPIIFSLITSIFLRITNSEFLPRVFMSLISIASVVGIYLFGKELFNKKVGLISSFLMSIFYLNLFFTYRLLVDLPSLTFFTFSGFLFYRYFKTNSKNSLHLASLLVAIGMLFKLSTAFLLLPCIVYLIVTENFKLFKKKEIFAAILIFIATILPYILWGYSEFGGFVLTQASSHVSPGSYSQGIPILINYIKLFPTYFSWTLLLAFVFGIGMLYKVFLYFDLLIKGNEKIKRDFFLLLVLIIPIVLVSFLIGHNENRYIITTFPVVFIIASSFIVKAYDFLKKHNKVVAIIVLIIILGNVTFFQIKSADSLIKVKVDSYYQVKEAGLWLRENSAPSDIIATRSQPQTRYYSERATIGIPATKEEFERDRIESNPKFFIISIFETHQEWMYYYPEENNLTILKVYEEGGQPVLIIYEL